VELRRANSVEARAVSDRRGGFRFQVPAGTYELTARSGESAFPRCPHVDVTVREGEFTHIDIACDSGMR
jgi:hypothetical protein